MQVTNIETNIKNIDVRRLWSPSKENSNEWREEKLMLEEPIVLPPEEFSDHPRIAKTEEPIAKSSSRSANSTPLPARRKKFSSNKRISSRLSREETACQAAFQLLASRFPHVERLVTLFPGPETRTRVHVLQEILDLKNEALKDENADENILLLPPSENAHTFAELQGALLKRIQIMQEVSREEETELRLLWNSNMQECRQLEDELTKVAKTMEMDKFKLHLVEFGKMVSLLIGLSGRLVKVESALKSLNWNGPEERDELEARKTKLERQLEEACALKVAIDKRSLLVRDYVGSYLGEKKQDLFDRVLASRSSIMVRLREAQEQVVGFYVIEVPISVKTFLQVRLADSQAATVRQLQEGKVQSEII